MRKDTCTLRDRVEARDVEAVRRIASSSGFFRPDEIQIAVELVEERLAKGLKSGYHFLFLDRGDLTLGFSCFGPIACTIARFDLYWIAVEDSSRGHGMGTWLLLESEDAIRRLGGKRVYAETSGQPRYDPTRKFYQSRGYKVDALLPAFYAVRDDKYVFCKVLKEE